MFRVGIPIFASWAGRCYRCRSIVFAAVAVVLAGRLEAGVVINEIMYHSANSDLEYIELLNTSTEPVDLSGWVFKDNNDAHSFRFPAGTIIAPGDYLVVADDPSLFRDVYGFDAHLGGFSFNLSNAGDAVRVFHPAGQCVESVAYDDREPWPESTDGYGASLERRNPLLMAELATSWAASSSNGTPGRPNSTYTEELPPTIIAVDHSPRIPQPLQDVTVTARVSDPDGDLASVNLYHGKDRGTAYQAVLMLDDGEHGDGASGDGVFGAQIPGADLSSILRFYICAVDTDGLTTTLPDDGPNQPFLTVVERPLHERVAALQIVMRPEIQQRFLERYQTDEYFPATFYDDDTVYYSVHIRHRGRSRSQNSRFKIRFPHSRLFRGEIRRLNLNGTDYNSLIQEFLSYRLYEDAGLPNLQTEIVRFHINGRSARGIPYRVAVENPDSQFLRRKRFFENDNGNLYKTTLDGTPQNKATWRYIGDDPALYSDCYYKQTNEAEADWGDIIRLCKILTETNTWDDDYVEKVRSVLNTDVFLKWIAISALVAHWDSPFTDHGQNYVLYNNPETGRFNIIVWDLNGTFNYSSNHENINYRKHYTHVRSTKFDAINKILNHPVFGAQYYREIDRFLDTLFTQESMNQRIESARADLGISSSQVQYLKTYVGVRRRDLALWINRDGGVAFLTKPVYQVIFGEPYTYRAVAVDYRHEKRVSYVIERGPAWLMVDSESGLVRGTPPEEGRFEIVVAARTQSGTEISQSYTLQVTLAEPKLIMTFNEESGPASDLSNHGHVGQFRGNAKRVLGRLGSAVYLDGSGDYVQIPHSADLNLSGEVTVEAWIRADSISSGNPVIITKGQADHFNYVLMLGYGPFSWDRMEPCFMPHRFGPEHRVFYGRKEIEAQLRARRWYHIAGTYDSAREVVRVYCNNRRICESASRALMPENTYDLLIGLPGSRCFKGAVDDVRILPFAKTAFPAGLCLSRVDISGISPAQDRVSLSLSAHRSGTLDTSGFALHFVRAARWLRLPGEKLAPGETVSWWLDDLGMNQSLLSPETLALYPASSLEEPSRRTILDQVVWGENGPSDADPGVQAGFWLEGRSLRLLDQPPWTITLGGFCDNDEMDKDWAVQVQEMPGPRISSVVINGGSVQTVDRLVTISLTVEGEPTKMRIANSPDFGRQWLPYRSAISWELPPGNGLKAVYVQVLDDKSGHRSPVRTGTIWLESQTEVETWTLHK